MRNEFSVCQWYGPGLAEGKWEYVGERFVSGEKAIETMMHAVEGCLGQVEKYGDPVRVIITDGGDNIAAQWMKEKGFTYPPELVELKRMSKFMSRE